MIKWTKQTDKPLEVQGMTDAVEKNPCKIWKVSMLKVLISGPFRRPRVWRLDTQCAHWKHQVLPLDGNAFCQIWRFQCWRVLFEAWPRSNAWTGVFGGFLVHIEFAWWKMVGLARAGKKLVRFEDFHVERCHSRRTTDRTHETHPLECFRGAPSLHGENGRFCQSEKKSLSDLKISMLNDVIRGVPPIERMKWSILSVSVAYLVCLVKMVGFARAGKKFVRFEDFHVERCHSRRTADRTHEVEHLEDFCAYLVCMVKMVGFGRAGRRVCQVWGSPCWNFIFEAYHRSNAWNGAFWVFLFSCRPSLLRRGESIITSGPQAQFHRWQKKSRSEIKSNQDNKDRWGLWRKIMNVILKPEAASQSQSFLQTISITLPPCSHAQWGPTPRIELCCDGTTPWKEGRYKVGTFAGHTGHGPCASFVVERVPPQSAPTRWLCVGGVAPFLWVLSDCLWKGLMLWLTCRCILRWRLVPSIAVEWPIPSLARQYLYLLTTIQWQPWWCIVVHWLPCFLFIINSCLLKLHDAWFFETLERLALTSCRWGGISYEFDPPKFWRNVEWLYSLPVALTNGSSCWWILLPSCTSQTPLHPSCSSWTEKMLIRDQVQISLSWTVSPFTVLHAFRWITWLFLMGGTLSVSAWRGVLSHGVTHDRQAPGKPGDIGHSYPVPLTCRSIVTLCLPGQ